MNSKVRQVPRLMTLSSSLVKNACEVLLTGIECLEVLKTIESEKAPGTDSLPAEFYKVFWNDTLNILIDALNFAYETGQLSVLRRKTPSSTL